MQIEKLEKIFIEIPFAADFQFSLTKTAKLFLQNSLTDFAFIIENFSAVQKVDCSMSE